MEELGLVTHLEITEGVLDAPAPAINSKQLVLGVDVAIAQVSHQYAGLAVGVDAADESQALNQRSGGICIIVGEVRLGIGCSAGKEGGHFGKIMFATSRHADDEVDAACNQFMEQATGREAAIQQQDITGLHAVEHAQDRAAFAVSFPVARHMDPGDRLDRSDIPECKLEQLRLVCLAIGDLGPAPLVDDRLRRRQQEAHAIRRQRSMPLPQPALTSRQGRRRVEQRPIQQQHFCGDQILTGAAECARRRRQLPGTPTSTFARPAEGVPVSFVSQDQTSIIPALFAGHDQQDRDGLSGAEQSLAVEAGGQVVEEAPDVVLGRVLMRDAHEVRPPDSRAVSSAFTAMSYAPSRLCHTTQSQRHWLPLDNDAAAEVAFTTGGFTGKRSVVAGLGNAVLDWPIPQAMDLKEVDRLITAADKLVKEVDVEKKRPQLAALLIGTQLVALDEARQVKVDALLQPIAEEFANARSKLLKAMGEDPGVYKQAVADMQRMWKGCMPGWFKEAQDIGQLRQQIVAATTAKDQGKPLAPLRDALVKGIAATNDPLFRKQYETLMEMLDAVPATAMPKPKK